MGKVVSCSVIEDRIFLLRGHKVMLSPDLARLYEVEQKALLQAVKRNVERFPQDFMFQLSWDEVESLRSQIVTLNEPLEPSIVMKRGAHIKYRPYAFTEQGVAMLSRDRVSYVVISEDQPRPNRNPTAQVGFSATCLQRKIFCNNLAISSVLYSRGQ